MKDAGTTNKQTDIQECGQSLRLPYEPPVLISYNASANTRGGAKTVPTGDSIGSVTNYKIAS